MKFTKSRGVIIAVFIMSLQTVANGRKLYWGHKVVRAFPSSTDDVQRLSKLRHHESMEEVDFWRPPSHVNSFVDMRVSSNDFKKLCKLLKEYNISYQIQIFDLQAVFDKQNDVLGKTASWHSRYHPLQQIVAKMREIDQSSNMVRMSSVGKSYEKRDQFLLQIQSNPDKPKPVVFMNCGIHAREWVSPATCMYIVDQIVSGYGKVPSVTAMLNKVDFTIMPVLNVDGYEFSWTEERLWRKNRSPNGESTCVGTDLNRNWQFGWGGKGASTNPCQVDYRGVSSMSEVEVQNVDKFLKSQQSRLVGFLDVHAYSQLWMIPWAYTKQKTKDNDELMRIGKTAVQAIRSSGFNTTYRLGASSRLLYECSGSLEDYVYGSLKVKYAFAVELRDTGIYGFALPASLIQPTASEMFEGLKAMVREMRINGQ